MKRITTLLLLCLCSASLVATQQTEPNSPQQIVDKMLSIYATCTSYSDEGKVETIFYHDDGRSRTLIKRISTAFVRPSRFRFEFESNEYNRSNDYVIWRDESHVKSWWSIKPEVPDFETLNMALGAAAGVSELSSINVPGMLLEEMRPANRFRALSKLRMTGEEKVDGKPSYRMEGTEPSGVEITIWIDKESLLLLKIYQTRKFPDFSTKQTITYRPQINKEVPPNKLAFNH